MTISSLLWDSPPDVARTTVETLSSFQESSIGREEWDRFVYEVGGDLYVTYDWCRIWWQHYGDLRQLRLYIFRRGGQLVGLAPMFIEEIRLGLIKLKIAKESRR